MSKNNVPIAPGWYWAIPYGADRMEPVYVNEDMLPGLHEEAMQWAWEWVGPIPLPNTHESFSASISRMARILGMQAENDQRKACGHSMAYVEEDFLNEAR